MDVSTIRISWGIEPPQTGVRGDWMKLEGSLFKDDSLVAELPEVAVLIEIGPEATRPSTATLWEISPAIDADRLELHAYDFEATHALLVDGREFRLEGKREYDEIWVAFEIDLRSWLKRNWPWVAIGGTGALSAIIYALARRR